MWIVFIQLPTVMRIIKFSLICTEFLKLFACVLNIAMISELTLIYIFSFTPYVRRSLALNVFILTPQKADLGLDDLTVTSQRSQVVDFSTPFQTSSLKIMTKVSILTQFLNTGSKIVLLASLTYLYVRRK